MNWLEFFLSVSTQNGGMEENVIRSFIVIVMSSEWVKIQHRVYYPFKNMLINTEHLFLTSQPGGAVGLGRRSVDAEALARQHAAVLGLLHQEAYLRQQSVQETRQHGCASDHHHILRQHLPSVNGALRGNTVRRNCPL